MSLEQIQIIVGFAVILIGAIVAGLKISFYIGGTSMQFEGMKKELDDCFAKIRKVEEQNNDHFTIMEKENQEKNNKLFDFMGRLDERLKNLSDSMAELKEDFKDHKREGCK